MLKFIWFFLMGCLIIGIFFMGNVIFESPSDTGEEMRRLQSQVKEKVQDLKNDAIEKRKAMNEMLKGVRGSLGQQKEPQTEKGRSSEMIRVRVKPAPPRATEALDLNPLDEEDRRLTAEILRGGAGSEKSLEKTRQNMQTADVGATDKEDFYTREVAPPQS